MQIVEQYLAAWNERNAEARLTRVVAAFAPEASYQDPLMQGAGHAAIDAMIAGAQGHFPGHRFELAGTPDSHGDVLRFSWTLAEPGSEAVAKGTDFAVVAADGRLRSVTGFIDYFAQ
ncbi:SnoaL-like domain-containing protein [Duganella sp. CF458]|uniref:nuclear transport factor 2 family protein n=1 Tax=Duganella sp. CF458 TaxID=1884368 RepID=UPI0008E3ABC1|nr:nuclear transport factor 2 family protein [Duganella sp. CF458]SFF63200.1 SnoaL-like domain-containing protein [Duganella sp. CF458]